MASPTHHETSTLTGGPPPESSVRDFAAATNATTDIAVEPVAEHTVDPSAAAVAALQDLARGTRPSEEIDLTVEPDFVSYIGEDARVTQIRALSTLFRRMLKNASNGCSTLQLETIELLPHMMEGALQYIGQQQVTYGQMQEGISSLQMENAMLHGVREKLHKLETDSVSAGVHIENLISQNHQLDRKWRDLESTVVRFETTNQFLRIENKRLESELKAVRAVSAGDATESDTEGQNKKRSRGEAGFEGTAGDIAESDMEDGIKKRGRRET